MKRFYLLPLILFASCRPKEPADLVLHNGKIVTADEAFSIHEAVVVKDGKILDVQVLMTIVDGKVVYERS
jgi:predicted amidohydrolase YtcJ